MRAPYRASLPTEIKDSLEACWREGVTTQIALNAFDYYLVPYALFLGATAQEIGLLVAIPNLLSSVAQLFAVEAVQLAGNRRLTLVYGMAWQSCLLLPLILLPLVPFNSTVTLLILLITVFRVTGSIMGPAWGSLVSDYLPEGQRGQYFGWRSRVVSIAGIAGIALWGLLLAGMKQLSMQIAFAALFAGATFLRFASLHYMRKMADLPVHPAPDSHFTLWMFLKRFRESNFVKFVFYVSGITFAAQLAAPYFSVHMLQNLHFGYLGYTAVQMASVISSLAAFPLWGRHADRVGTARIMKSTSFLMPLIPLLWMAARSVPALIVVELFSGFLWSGFTLASTNFIFDAVSPAKRVNCLAYFNLIAGGAVFAGAGLGGWLADILPPLFGFSLITLFLVSALFRFGSDFILSRHFEEVLATAEPMSSAQLFLSVAGLRPMIGPNQEPDMYAPLRPSRADEPVPNGKK